MFSASTVAAHADGATIPDPNLAPINSEAEPGLVASNASGPELASIPDPNLAPSTNDVTSEAQAGLLSVLTSSASDTTESAQ